jgi:hypothetical protein
MWICVFEAFPPVREVSQTPQSIRTGTTWPSRVRRPTIVSLQEPGFKSTTPSTTSPVSNSRVSRTVEALAPSAETSVITIAAHRAGESCCEVTSLPEGILEKHTVDRVRGRCAAKHAAHVSAVSEECSVSAQTQKSYFGTELSMRRAGLEGREFGTRNDAHIKRTIGAAKGLFGRSGVE